jgi:bacillithiol biosynthesis cysteine-adding enzyme BshC
MTAPRVISQPLGGSPLAVAAQRGAAAEWYPERPTGEGWRGYLRGVAEPYRGGTWRHALGPALAATGDAATRLDRVAEAGGVVVSTGQQAALFGGPLYTLIKALSALAIADAMERETGVPTAPVFWAATDDADYEEACWAALAVTGGTRVLRLPPSTRPGVPMSRMPLRDVEALLDVLAGASGSVVEAGVIEQARRAFRSGETLGNAYLRLLRVLLEPLGIPVLDASHPAVRATGAAVLVRALDDAVPLERTLRARYDAIRDRGYTPQVEHLSDLTLVFAEDGDGEKRRIPIRDARAHVGLPPGKLGPNVLLRPVLERFIMPSACYVAGPGELAYFAQVGAVAAALNVPSPLPLPRWSATILEPRIERLLERLGATREELRDRPAVESRLARVHLPVAVADRLRALRKDVDDDLFALEQADRDKLLPGASLEGVRHWVHHRLQRLERRYAAAVKRREIQLMQDIATAAASLYPNGKPQERVLNFIPFWARYGAPLIAAMRAEADIYARSLLDISTPEPMPEGV